MSDYGDTNSGINKLIESKVTSNDVKWLVHNPGNGLYVAVQYGDNTIYVKQSGIISVSTKTFDEYFEGFSYKFAPENIVNSNIVNSIDVDKIISDYKNNAINAASEYAQRNIVISGKVKSVETASYSWDKEMGSCIVSVYNSSSFDYIKCYFSNSNDVSSLNSGDKIYIEGTFVGEDGGSIYLHMKNCKIIDD